MKKERLDRLVVARGLVDSREKAQRMILAGKVLIDGHVYGKSGMRIDSNAKITAKEKPRFVGRGGEKLEGAFRYFNLDVDGMVCMDVGSSTGGFADCMLQHGAAKVYCIDVGKGQLDWKLRNDDRVIVMENVNARYLESASFPEKPRFATIDVSFISLTKVLPAVIKVISPGAELVLLIKPQFEARRDEVARGGVVRDPETRKRTVDKVRDFGVGELDLEFVGVEESPLRGPAGNIEYLAHCKVPGSPGRFAHSHGEIL